MNKPLLTIFALLMCVLAYGQNAYQLSWDKNMEYIGTVPTKNQIKDNSGEYCALLKIDIPLDSVDIRGDLIMGKPFKDGDSWYVFVSTFSKDKSITIQASHYYPISVPLMTNEQKGLEANSAYLVRITPPEDVNAQKSWITFVSAKKQDFTVVINNDNEIVADNGKAMTNLFYGEYEYEIKGTSKKGKFELTGPPVTIYIDEENTQRGFGILMVNYKPVGANVYLDDKLMGKTPNVYNKIAVGKYIMRIEKSGFVTKLDTVTISKDYKTLVQGNLTASKNSSGNGTAKSKSSIATTSSASSNNTKNNSTTTNNSTNDKNSQSVRLVKKDGKYEMIIH